MRQPHLYIFAILAIILYSCNDDDKVIPAPTIYLSMPDGGYNLDKDSTFVISPKITYDIASTYNWDLNGESVNTSLEYTVKDYTFGDYHFLFSVETASGKDTITIPVHIYDIFTFEETDTLNSNGYFNHPDNGFFTFANIALSNEYTSDENDGWSGFAMSKNTNKTSSSISNQFSVYASSGSESSKLFTVFRQSNRIDHKILFTDNKAHIVHSIDVNNSTYTYLNMNSVFDKKDNKDYFCLSITGYDASGMAISSIDYYLADYRFATLSDRYLISSWNTVDLTALGEVYAIGFHLSSSLDNNSENQIPKYFCLDNLKLRS